MLFCNMWKEKDMTCLEYLKASVIFVKITSDIVGIYLEMLAFFCSSVGHCACYLNMNIFVT